MVSLMKKTLAAAALSALAVVAVASPSSAHQRSTYKTCSNGHTYTCLVQAIDHHIRQVGDRPENCRPGYWSSGKAYYKCTTTYAQGIPV